MKNGMIYLKDRKITDEAGLKVRPLHEWLKM